MNNSSKPNVKIRILLADQHALFRESLRSLLQADAGLQVVAEAKDAEEVIGEASLSLPEVVVLSSDLVGRPGDIMARIKDVSPRSRVLVLSGNDDPEVLMIALEAGAKGYMSKQCPLSELIEAMRTISQGEVVIPGRMLKDLIERLLNRRQDQKQALRRMARLTRREREILAMLVQGADNTTIANTLFISPQTSRTHVQNVLGKLEVHSRLEAAAFVTQNGITHDLEVLELANDR